MRLWTADLGSRTWCARAAMSVESTPPLNSTRTEADLRPDTWEQVGLTSIALQCTLTASFNSLNICISGGLFHFCKAVQAFTETLLLLPRGLLSSGAKRLQKCPLVNRRAELQVFLSVADLKFVRVSITFNQSYSSLKPVYGEAFFYESAACVLRKAFHTHSSV